MNQDISLSREQRQAAVELLLETLRASQLASDLLDQAFADFIGINRTDLRSLEIVDQHQRMTAGDLARKAGLTTGAVTAVIDRLETAGLLRRVNDPTDRRKVFVELTPAAEKLGVEVYGPLGRSGQIHLDDLSDDQVLTIIGFLEVTRRITDQHTEAIRARPDGGKVPLRYRLEQVRAIKNEAKALMKTIKNEVKGMATVVVEIGGSHWERDEKGNWTERAD
jgi:DNA-binding MarR family transcriptional regulator